MPELSDLIAIIRELFRFKEPLSEKTRLWHDLRLSGDDAYELLVDVRKKYGTSFESMDFGRYFPDETEGMFHSWAERFGMKSRFDPVTLGHLLAVVRAGRWYDEG